MNKMEYKPITLSIFELSDKYRKGEIIIDHEMQRNIVWTDSFRIGLIDTLIKGYPIPLIFVEKKIVKTRLF